MDPADLERLIDRELRSLPAPRAPRALLPQLRAAVATISFVADSTRDVEVTTNAVRVLWRTLLAPVMPWAFGLLTLMCAACAVFGTVLNHLVFGRAFR